MHSLLREFVTHVLTESHRVVPREDVPSTLYHITAAKNAQSIQDTGLVPTSGWESERRIYLGTSEDVVIDLAEWMIRSRKCALFKVDVTSIPDHVFYFDENISTGEAIWTDEPIPPSALELVEIFDLYD